MLFSRSYSAYFHCLLAVIFFHHLFTCIFAIDRNQAIDSAGRNPHNQNIEFNFPMNPSSTLSAEELVEIVDENNQPTVPRLRREMRAHKLIHRATYAFVRNKHNYFYVQKRSALKDYCPSYFDANPGGVVAAGESYEITNQRELEEEMGIPSDTPCKHLFTFYFEDERIKCFGDAWEVEYDGPLKLQVEEVESIHLMSMDEILQRSSEGEKFTPDSIHACKLYVEKFGSPSPTGPKIDPELIPSV